MPLNLTDKQRAALAQLCRDVAAEASAQVAAHVAAGEATTSSTTIQSGRAMGAREIADLIETLE